MSKYIPELCQEYMSYCKADELLNSAVMVGLFFGLMLGFFIYGIAYSYFKKKELSKGE